MEPVTEELFSEKLERPSARRIQKYLPIQAVPQRSPLTASLTQEFGAAHDVAAGNQEVPPEKFAKQIRPFCHWCGLGKPFDPVRHLRAVEQTPHVVGTQPE